MIALSCIISKRTYLSVEIGEDGRYSLVLRDDIETFGVPYTNRREAMKQYRRTVRHVAQDPAARGDRVHVWDLTDVWDVPCNRRYGAEQKANIP